MTEEQYICVRNRVKVGMAYNIMQSVHPGDDFGITEEAHQEIVDRLHDAACKLDIPHKFEISCEVDKDS